MLDLLETIFIWGLYVILPLILITRFGGQKAGVSLMAIFIFNSLVTDPSEILVNSTSINSDLNEIVLVKNKKILIYHFIVSWKNISQIGLNA